jgi:hypothetical protein
MQVSTLLMVIFVWIAFVENKMGDPIHYSLELPQRCLQLIDELWPVVERTRQWDMPHLGPLSTTFLISMSMPIINLPIERIERHRSGGPDTYANDRKIDPEISAAVDKVLGSQPLHQAPFFGKGEWHFATRTQPPFPNIAERLPDTIAELLGTEEASERAEKMPTSQWCSILRNALAHGGIGYLDEDGRSTYGNPVKMLLFVSGKFDPANPKKLTAVNLLRISETDYRAFLGKWVVWLLESGISKTFAAA